MRHDHGVSSGRRIGALFAMLAARRFVVFRSLRGVQIRLIPRAEFVVPSSPKSPSKSLKSKLFLRYAAAFMTLALRFSLYFDCGRRRGRFTALTDRQPRNM